MSSSLVKFPLDICLKRFIACVIIFPYNKWLSQQWSLAPYQHQHWKMKRKNCSRNTESFFLLNNWKRIVWLWDQIHPFWRLIRVLDDLAIERTEQYRRLKYLLFMLNLFWINEVSKSDICIRHWPLLVLFLSTLDGIYFRGAYKWNFLPKWIIVFISKKRIPSWIVDGQNKSPGSFTNAFEFLNVIGLACINFLVFNILGQVV